MDENQQSPQQTDGQNTQQNWENPTPDQPQQDAPGSEGDNQGGAPAEEGDEDDEQNNPA